MACLWRRRRPQVICLGLSKNHSSGASDTWDFRFQPASDVDGRSLWLGGKKYDMYNTCLDFFQFILAVAVICFCLSWNRTCWQEHRMKCCTAPQGKLEAGLCHLKTKGFCSSWKTNQCARQSREAKVRTLHLKDGIRIKPHFARQKCS